jgi:cysteine desulfurase
MIPFLKQFLDSRLRGNDTLKRGNDINNNRRVYLDNAGATPTSKKALAEFLRVSKIYGNPSAIFQEGADAQNVLKSARASIGKIINARAHEIYFTGSGTESCNLAILGTYYAWKKENEYTRHLPHIIVSAIEHPAVMEVIYYLSINSLINVTYLKVYEDGLVKVNDIREAINEHTILISVMYANNEIGTIQPIKEIGRMVDEYRKQKEESRAENLRSEFSEVISYKPLTISYPLFHTDACQAGNYLNLDVFRLKVDMMTLNSSKVYGPKGVGLLYKKEGVKIEPISFGGGQERGLRSGTESVALASAFAIALEESQEMKDKEVIRLRELRDYLKSELEKEISGITFYGAFEKKHEARSRKHEEIQRLPNNVNCRVHGIPSDEMIIRLDAKGFAVSHKSACASQTDDSSFVIRALGATEKEAKENIRITLGRDTTKKDLERLVKAIKEIVKKFGK